MLGNDLAGGAVEVGLGLGTGHFKPEGRVVAHAVGMDPLSSTLLYA